MLSILTGWGPLFVFLLVAVLFVVAFFTHRTDFRKRAGEILTTIVATTVAFMFALQQSEYSRSKEEHDKYLGYLVGSLAELYLHNDAVRRLDLTSEASIKALSTHDLPFNDQLLKTDTFVRETAPRSLVLILGEYARLSELRSSGINTPEIRTFPEADTPSKVKRFDETYTRSLETFYRLMCVQEREARGQLPRDSPYTSFVRETLWVGPRMKDIGCDEIHAPVD
jgi:hypothetical protein